MAVAEPLAELAGATESLLTRLNFRALTNPVGPAIDLTWELPDPAQPPDAVPLVILRRERRFPGLNRRGNVAVAGTVQDLSDGDLVYDTATFTYDFEEPWEERDGDLLVETTYQYVYMGVPRDRLLVRSLRREYFPDANTPIHTLVRVIDRANLAPETLYYYTAFAGNARLYSALTQASALATGRTTRSLFDLLPQVHQRLDTSRPLPNTAPLADVGKGQLQRLTEVFDAHADMLQAMVAAMRDLRSPRQVDSRLLPALAHLLGWRLKGYLNEDDQRNEILFAPEVYRTVGTIPNLAAMVNRLTGWDTRVREYATSIVMSFDSSRLESLQGGTPIYLDGRVQVSATPPHLTGSRVPFGSVDTSDPMAMFRLRTRAFDDTTAYTYDCGTPDGQGNYRRDNDTWYNRETVGLYIVPDVETEPFRLEEEWNRVRQIIGEFLPIQVRVVFVVQPGVVVEEAYNAVRDVTEGFVDVGVELKDETYTGAVDAGVDRIPGWQWFVTNALAHHSVDTSAVTIDTASRTWHTGLDQGL